MKRVKMDLEKCPKMAKTISNPPSGSMRGRGAEQTSTTVIYHWAPIFLPFWSKPTLQKGPHWLNIGKVACMKHGIGIKGLTKNDFRGHFLTTQPDHAPLDLGLELWSLWPQNETNVGQGRGPKLSQVIPSLGLQWSNHFARKFGWICARSHQTLIFLSLAFLEPRGVF